MFTGNVRHLFIVYDGYFSLTHTLSLLFSVRRHLVIKLLLLTHFGAFM